MRQLDHALVLALSTLLGCAAPAGSPGGTATAGPIVADMAAMPAGHQGMTAPPDPHAGHTPAPDGERLPPASPSGYAPVMLDPARPGGLLLTTVKVEQRDFTRKLRTTGVITLDETRSAHVHPKVRGWIDGISVNFVGRKVASGEALCSIYSQEVFAAELEFLAMLESSASFPVPSGEFGAAELKAQQQLLGASRRRLSLWDVPRSEVARLESTRQPRRTFSLSAPRAGVVVAKQAIQGMYVDPSLELYTLSDLSHVWVQADVYEGDVPYVHVGDQAHLTIQGKEGGVHAKVAFVPPMLDEVTRTLKIRFDLDNQDGSLRPGAFVSVALDLPLGAGLSLPESAVIRTGTRAVVFVMHGAHGEAREITLGPLVGDRYRIDGGLAAGDEVATSAQFLLDSESRLRGSSAPGGGHVH